MWIGLNPIFISDFTVNWNTGVNSVIDFRWIERVDNPTRTLSRHWLSRWLWMGVVDVLHGRVPEERPTAVHRRGRVRRQLHPHLRAAEHDARPVALILPLGCPSRPWWPRRPAYPRLSPHIYLSVTHGRMALVGKTFRLGRDLGIDHLLRIRYNFTHFLINRAKIVVPRNVPNLYARRLICSRGLNRLGDVPFSFVSRLWGNLTGLVCRGLIIPTIGTCPLSVSVRVLSSCASAPNAVRRVSAYQDSTHKHHFTGLE